MTTPIVCDMSGAPDTPAERLAEYGRLFGAALVSRERTERGTRWRFRSGPGIEDRARDLAAREESCCAFLGHTIARVGDEVWWEVTSVDDPAARAVLDLFFDLPEHLWTDAAAVRQRFAEATGTQIIVDGPTAGPSTPADADAAR